MKEETLSMLCIPGSHEELKKISMEDEDGIIREYLVGLQNGEKFIIKDGIPLMIQEKLKITGFNLRYQRLYNKIAGIYDLAIFLVSKFSGKSEEASRRQYLNELNIQPGHKLLEVSVGTGSNFRYLPADVALWGLDLSWGMLKKCKKNLKKWKLEAELVFGNAENLPFKDNSFDSVLHVGGINAFNNRKAAIEEMIRVAKHGSNIIIVDETFKTVKSIKWIPGSKKIIREFGERLSAPVDLVPKNMLDIKVKSISKDYLYCLSFRKPHP